MYFLIAHTPEWYRPHQCIYFLIAHTFEGIYFLSVYIFGMHVPFEGIRTMKCDPRHQPRCMSRVVQYIICWGSLVTVKVVPWNEETRENQKQSLGSLH